MNATISKIHPLKRSRNGNSFIRVEFQMEDGAWATTDLCPSYRNYNRWHSLLQVGRQLTGLSMRGKSKVDADSFVVGLDFTEGVVPTLSDAEEEARYIQQKLL